MAKQSLLTNVETKNGGPSIDFSWNFFHSSTTAFKTFVRFWLRFLPEAIIFPTPRSRRRLRTYAWSLAKRRLFEQVLLGLSCPLVQGTSSSSGIEASQDTPGLDVHQVHIAGIVPRVVVLQ